MAGRNRNLSRIERRLQLAAAGLCTECRQPRQDGATPTLCENCAQARRDRYQVRKTHTQSHGLCVFCQKLNDRQPLTICTTCSDSRRAYNLSTGRVSAETDHNYTLRKRAFRELKLCFLCGENTPFLKGRCETCLAEHRKQHREIKSNSNTCIYCSEPSLDTVTKCEEHWYREKSYTHLGTTKRWKELRSLARKQNFRCAYTGETIAPGSTMSVDHVIPKSHERYPGDNNIDNLCWTTWTLNRCKSNLTSEELLSLCRAIVSYSADSMAA
jgi:hypothetical protein